jgi:hypothetical protein
VAEVVDKEEGTVVLDRVTGTTEVQELMIDQNVTKVVKSSIILRDELVNPK